MGVGVGFSRRRVDGDGRQRWTAVYRDARGQIRSAGTFATEKAADRAWHRAEDKIAEGRIGDPRRGRQIFRSYVEDEWLPHHVMEASTREGYTYMIYKHILPWFGPMRMVEILPANVREWITELGKSGVSPSMVQKLRFVLSAIFTTALNDQITFLHPCKGIKTPTVATKPLTIITPEQFDMLYACIPNADMQLLIETDIETGFRWGELTELRPKDLDMPTRTFTVRRAVVELNPKFHPTGGRFLVKGYPKDGEYRRVKVSQQLTDKIKAYIADTGRGPDDLLFRMRIEDQPRVPEPRVPPDPATLGQTEPDARGRRYRHGTLSAYNAAKCRCRPCKDAIAIYRTSRRNGGKDRPQVGRPIDTDGHIPNSWFHHQVWRKACAAAGLGTDVRPHDLRHAHASWLLAGGADLQVVKERLGHGSIKTTERYLHTLPDQDETAVDAFMAIRNRRRSA
jgi:integrase